jgi:hypothetical protein
MKLIKKKLFIFSAIFILSTFFAGLHAMDASVDYLPLIEKIEFEQDKTKLYNGIQNFFNQKPKSVEEAKLLWNMYLNFISPQYNVLVKEGSIELKNRIALTENFTKFSLYCENVVQKPLPEAIQKTEAEIRKHIRIEQQCKICIDNLE